jgi:hypothetical protein
MAYSQALRSGQPVEAKTSWGRFVLTDGARPFDPHDEPATASLGEGEVHEVPPPPLALLDLPDEERRRALLHFLHKHLLILARKRQWPTGPFDAAHAAVLDGGIRFQLASAPKSSPDRRHRVSVDMEIDGAGDAWLHLTVVDRDGDVVHTSPPLMTDVSVRNFNAVKRNLRWADATTVVVDTWPLDESRFEWAQIERFYTARLHEAA